MLQALPVFAAVLIRSFISRTRMRYTDSDIHEVDGRENAMTVEQVINPLAVISVTARVREQPETLPPALDELAVVPIEVRVHLRALPIDLAVAVDHLEGCIILHLWY